MSLFRQLLQYLGLVKPEPVEAFRNKQQTINIIEQNVYTMVNTITFSTGMEKLFLIDAGRSIEFDLAKNNGILVGTLRGQITVATAFDFPKPEGDSGSGGMIELPMSIKLSTEKTVWSGAFHQKRRILCLIGATEIEIRTPGDAEEFDYKPVLHFFDIEENTLHIRRKKNDIFVLSIPKDIKR